MLCTQHYSQLQSQLGFGVPQHEAWHNTQVTIALLAIVQFFGLVLHLAHTTMTLFSFGRPMDGLFHFTSAIRVSALLGRPLATPHTSVFSS
jgi:hypothetical protein